jgi:hypothetical protein
MGNGVHSITKCGKKWSDQMHPSELNSILIFEFLLQFICSLDMIAWLFNLL